MQQGTPWWLTAILMALSALLTNQLAVRRERAKGSVEWSNAWRKRFSEAVVAVCDSSSRHFSNVDEIKNTHTSSCLILNGLKRVSSLRQEIEFIDPSNAKRFRDAYQNFHYVITGPEDFQTEDRTVRLPNDPIFERMRDAEDALIKVARSRLRVKGQ